MTIETLYSATTARLEAARAEHGRLLGALRQAETEALYHEAQADLLLSLLRRGAGDTILADDPDDTEAVEHDPRQNGEETGAEV